MSERIRWWLVVAAAASVGDRLVGVVAVTKIDCVRAYAILSAAAVSCWFSPSSDWNKWNYAILFVVVAISGSVVLWTCQGRQPVVAGDLQKSCVLCTIFTLYHFILRYIVAFCDVYSTQTDRYRYYFRCPADLADQAKCLTWCMYVQFFFLSVRLSSCISKEKEDKKTKQLPIHILIKLNISNKTGL